MRGFTLLELLVVLSMLAVLSAIVLVTRTPSTRPADAAHTQAGMLIEQLRLASDITMLTGRRFGLRVESNSHAVVELRSDGVWVLADDDGLMVVSGTSIGAMVVDGRRVQQSGRRVAVDGSEAPAMMNDALGDWPDFSLSLAAGEGGARTTLRVAHRPPGRFETGRFEGASSR